MIQNRKPSIEGTVVVWDLPVRLFHWGLVAAFVAAFVTAGAYGKLHQAAGYSLAALVAFRLVWGFVGNRYARFDSFVRPPRTVIRYLLDMFSGHGERHLGHNPAGGMMILALLALCTILGFTGWLQTTPQFFGDERLRILHETTAYVTVSLIPLHLAGVIVSSIAHRENLVEAMLSGRKRQNRPGEGVIVDEAPIRALGGRLRAAEALVAVLAIALALQYLVPKINAQLETNARRAKLVAQVESARQAEQPAEPAAAKAAAVEQASPQVAAVASKATDKVDKQPAEPAAGSKAAAIPASPEIVVADKSIRKPGPGSAAAAIDQQVEEPKQAVVPALDQPAIDVAKAADKAASDEAGARGAAKASDHGIAKADARRPAGSAIAAVDEASVGDNASGPRLVDLVTPTVARAIGGNDKSFDLSRALAFEDPQLELAGTDAKDFSQVSSGADALVELPADEARLAVGEAIPTPSEPGLSPPAAVVTEYEDDDFDDDDHEYDDDDDHEYEQNHKRKDDHRSAAVVEDSPTENSALVSRIKPAKSEVVRPNRKQLKAQRDLARALKRSQKAKSVAQVKVARPSVANAVAAPAKKKVARSSAGLQSEKAKPVAKTAKVRVAVAALSGRAALKAKRTARTLKQKAAKKRLLLVGFISGRDRWRGGRGRGGGGDDHSGRGRGSDDSGGNSGSGSSNSGKGSSGSGGGGNSGKGGGND